MLEENEDVPEVCALYFAYFLSITVLTERLNTFYIPEIFAD